MSTKILARRGTAAQLSSVTLADGEFGWTTDTKNLYVGDGVTPGAIPVGGLLNISGAYIGASISVKARGLGAIDIQSSHGTGDAVAFGSSSFIFGKDNFASDNSSVVGSANIVSGTASCCLGSANLIHPNASTSIAFGFTNFLSGENSLAFGGQNNIFGYKSSAIGFGNAALNNFSTLIGCGLNNLTDNIISLGQNNTDISFPTRNQINIGQFWAATVGNSSFEMFLDGNGVDSPQTRLPIPASASSIIDISFVGGASGNIKGGKRFCVVQRNGTGAASLVGSVQTIGSDVSIGIATGNNIGITVSIFGNYLKMSCQASGFGAATFKASAIVSEITT